MSHVKFITGTRISYPKINSVSYPGQCEVRWYQGLLRFPEQVDL